MQQWYSECRTHEFAPSFRASSLHLLSNKVPLKAEHSVLQEKRAILKREIPENT